MRRFFVIAGLLITAYGCSTGQKIEWVSTTNSQPWVSNNGAVTTKSNAPGQAIIISPDSAKQVIDGFGGCFNELGWDALQTLTEQNRKAILKNLFDTIAGCRFTIFRMPIGANDYAVNWYSHDETAEDFDMKNFSLERDQ